jgi:hypothetical protein
VVEKTIVGDKNRHNAYIARHKLIYNQSEQTKGGLTSVYYRIRKSWKLKDVLSGDPSSSDADRMAVAARASNFSRGFLREIGYAM